MTAKKFKSTDYPSKVNKIVDDETNYAYYFAYKPDFGTSACSATGDTEEEALETLNKVAQTVIAHYLKEGKDLPKPSFDREAIQRKRAFLNKELERIYKEIEKLGKSCPHIKFKLEHGSNTGNYDPHDDCYWTNVECVDCGARWNLSGSHREKDFKDLIKGEKPFMKD